MEKLTKLVLIVALILVVGSVATAWLRFRRGRHQQSRLVLGPLCRQGVVSAETQPDAPVRLTIADAGCNKPQTASVQFVAENVSSLPISQYEVRAIETYDELIDKGSSVTEMGRDFNPHQTRIGFIGGGVFTTWGGKPVGPLRLYQITVASVTFTAGTTWKRDDLPHNVEPERRKRLSHQA